MNLIERNIEKIRDLCKIYRVKKLFVFGSVLRGDFNQKSDSVLVVDFQEIDLYNYADNYFDLKECFEKLFKRDVDLLEEKAIRNPFLRQSIDSSKKLIYG